MPPSGAGSGQSAMLTLGIDTSLRSTGYGVVRSAGSRLELVTHGVIRNPARLSLSACLLNLEEALSRVLEEYKPEAAAIEGIFFCRNLKTSVVLGEARGVAIAACARRAVPVYELAPRRVKQAVVGYGGAQKEQVGRMVMAMLGLTEPPPEDAADALALAISFIHTRSGVRVESLEPL